MCQLLIPNSQSVSEALLWGINWPGKGEEEKQIKDCSHKISLCSQEISARVSDPGEERGIFYHIL